MRKYQLFGPGPVNVDPRILEASIAVDYSHHQKAFGDLLHDTKRMLGAGGNKQVAIMPGSGTLAVEAAMFSFVESPLILSNGVYGLRMYDLWRGCRSDGYEGHINSGHGKEIDLNQVEERLKARKGMTREFKWVCLVHHETSTGILNPLEKICDLVEKYNVRVLVDAVSSYGGHFIDPRCNVVCTSSNKCLESTPGCAIVIYNQDKLQWVNRKVPRCLDVIAWTDKVLGTLPVNAITALHVALGLWDISRYERYAELADCVREHCPLEQVQYEADLANILTVFKMDGEVDVFLRRMEESWHVLYPGVLEGELRIANIGYDMSIGKLHRLFQVIGALL